VSDSKPDLSRMLDDAIAWAIHAGAEVGQTDYLRLTLTYDGMNNLWRVTMTGIASGPVIVTECIDPAEAVTSLTEQIKAIGVQG